MTALPKQDRFDWFRELKKAQSHAILNAYDLLVEIGMGQAQREEIKAATMRYVLASLGRPNDARSEDAMMAFLERNVDQLANRTPNGILMPKREFEDEFGGLHSSVASYVRTLGIDDLIYGISCPIVVRLVVGTSDPRVEARPYASSKVHMDTWAGDPGDEVVASMPMLGDIERTTVEYFQPPEEAGSRIVREMSSYDEGLQLLGECKPYPLRQRHGCAYFMDTTVPHRTVKRGGGLRVTVEFRLRRRTTEAERIAIEEATEPGRLAHFISLHDWYRLGTTKRMRFLDTYADAKRGIFVQRPYNESTYTVVDR
jgi:hypothetical protein